jgi:hypothetical protein
MSIFPHQGAHSAQKAPLHPGHAAWFKSFSRTKESSEVLVHPSFAQRALGAIV